MQGAALVATMAFTALALAALPTRRLAPASAAPHRGLHPDISGAADQVLPRSLHATQRGQLVNPHAHGTRFSCAKPALYNAADVAPS